eukprot:TRINITY_DN3683_c0_g1_i1.p1 TRINITY_DN3683_c0_g1~~TRINITY_DN3683_c0_g1_i1.p1  ORF type:complete len:221 (-),score=81.23 TRINITY_DN3683_c0_g1_i1:50-712(-)
MYTKKMAAVIHVVDEQEDTTKEFIREFKQVAKSFRGQFVFGKFSADKHAKLSEQVGMFAQYLPGLVVFDSKKLKYFSDRKMGRSAPQITEFLNWVKKGLATAKKPGEEKDEPSSKESKPASQLYEPEASSASASSSRLDKHETLLQQLVASQIKIQEAIGQIRDEIVDLRTDIEPMSGGKFYRKPVNVMGDKGTRSSKSDPHTGVLERTPEPTKPAHEEL